MSDKIPCGGLMERRDLCLVEVLGFPAGKGVTRGILTRFGEAGISLNYLSIGSDSEGLRNMSFCVGTSAMAEKRYLLSDIERELAPRKVTVNAPVTILTLYGPHFLDKHNLAAEVFKALCFNGIDVMTVCSSVNSISAVINIPDRDRAVDCLAAKFDWPR